MQPAFPIIFSGGWWFKGSSLDLDLQNNRSAIQGSPAGMATSQLSITRATVGYAQTTGGIWQSFASGAFRQTDKGLLIEEARTNSALWSRDMTNAAWVKTNMTTALTATGIDGTVNSATTLTATAGNATALQTIVSISQADTYSVWLKRVSGSGVVNISLDGVSWTAAAITTTWTQFQVTSTLLNPNIGIQIVTNGDVIAADFNQAELGQTFATSPILTTTVAATRNVDLVTVVGLGATIIPASASMFFQTINVAPTTPAASARMINLGSGQIVFSPNSTTTIAVSDGTNSLLNVVLGSGTTAGLVKSSYGLDNVSMTAIANGGTLGTQSTSTWATVVAGQTPYLGNRAAGDRSLNGYMQRSAFAIPKGLFDNRTV